MVDEDTIELNCYEDCLRIIDSVDSLEKAKKQIGLRAIAIAQKKIRRVEEEAYKGGV